MTTHKKEVWIDNVKVIACILVAVGHFFQSMVTSGIYAPHPILDWFDQMIYYFHVPLFFICSGYLYQKYSHVDSFYSWLHNTLKKLLTLGVPYLTFTVATWTLKTVFSDSVNQQADSFFYTLFLAPTSQMWYLYCLFFIFLITPTFSNHKTAFIAFLASIVLKLCFEAGHAPDITAISTVMSSEIWFVIGMCLSLTNFPKNILSKRILLICVGSFVMFIIFSVIFYVNNISFIGIKLFMGLIASISIISVIAIYFSQNEQTPFFAFLAKYTLPIYVMHTIFAAGLRSILLKFGCSNIFLHSVLGILISFLGPIIAAEIMKATKWLEFVLYPAKFIKRK